MNSRLLCSLAVCGALGLAACGDPDSGGDNGGNGGGTDPAAPSLSGQIAGAGASAQAAAQEAWIAGFQSANSGVSVAYDPVGSGGGREQFNAGGTLFGGTDSIFEDEELAAAEERCGGADNFIEAPVYISPIAVIYNLEGVEELQLAPPTIARIFAGEIETWNDQAIAADNPDAELPDTRITVVHRSDDSGTTENFQQYLEAASEGAWTEEPSDVWPISGQEAATGTSGVVGAVTEGAGTIGYADASQAGDLGTVAVGVGEGFVQPSPESAAAIFEESEETNEGGRFAFTYDLNRTPESAEAYPIVLTSYLAACTQYDNANDAEIVKAYLTYIVSEEGQQTAADNAGSAPIPDSVRSQVTEAIDAIGGGA